MTKAGRNEQNKIRATFFNSAAVGVIVAGFFVPTFGLYTGAITSYFGSIVVILLASLISFCGHMAALQYAAKLED